MNTDEQDLINRLHAVAEGFEMPPARPADDLRRGRRRLRRDRRLLASAAVTAVAIVLSAIAAIGALFPADRAEPDRLEPALRPSAVEPRPVWYDADGLHHGDRVEQTPVAVGGALALVRSGAVYLDPATGDVWLHPWGGAPRVVGRDSAVGPGGDPDGHTAAWFEGSDALNGRGGELVVYDTAAGRELSRTMQSHAVTTRHGDHRPPASGFLQVSAERVVWVSLGVAYSHDVRTRNTSEIELPEERLLEDVREDVQLLIDRGGSLMLSVPGRSEEGYPDLEPIGWLSPSGEFLLAVEGTQDRHAAVIVETRSGELWRVPGTEMAWSYGDVALLDTEDGLLACDAARRACERLDARRPLLMPSN